MKNEDSRFCGYAQAGSIALTVAILFGNAGPAVAHNYVGQCTVDFDNTFALTNTYGSTRVSDIIATGLNSSGRLDQCRNAAIPGVCWYYRHRCANNYVHVVESSVLSHFHLIFTDPGFDGTCGFVDPGDGYGSGYMKRVGSSCVVPNWSAEPRSAWSHNNIGIKMHPPGSMTTKTVFDLARLNIGGTVNVQVWFHSTLDGGWYGWPSMAPNNWNTLASAHDIDEVHVAGATYGEPPVILDFDILD